jgi:ankyrin repeat protein
MVKLFFNKNQFLILSLLFVASSILATTNRKEQQINVAAYRILGLSDANQNKAAIKKAYKALAKQWRPNKNLKRKELANAVMQVINQARNSLSLAISIRIPITVARGLGVLGIQPEWPKTMPATAKLSLPFFQKQLNEQLVDASHVGDLAKVKKLLAQGANVNAARKFLGPTHRQTPLYEAVRNGHTKVVGLLLGLGANVNTIDSKGWTPLFLAAMSGYVEIVCLLIGKGANVNAVDNSGEPSLFWAIRNGHTEVVRLLVEKGAKVNVANKDGYTLLFWAVDWAAYESIDIEIVRLLLDGGANVNEVITDSAYGGETPLFVAARHSYIEPVRLLLDRGADVNVVNTHGETPLFWAAFFGCTEVVRLLIDRGAKVNANTDKRTPLYAAIWLNHNDTEVARLLIDSGAKVDMATEEQQLIDAEAIKAVFPRYDDDILRARDHLGDLVAIIEKIDAFFANPEETLQKPLTQKEIVALVAQAVARDRLDLVNALIAAAPANLQTDLKEQAYTIAKRESIDSIAKELGKPIDKPRNLAKSVTVE